jgi:negative regulator of sigma E activity
MEESLKQHRIIVEKTGEQMVAGRNAAIVQIVSAGSASRHTGLQFTFWIDAETGIKLKQEVTGPHGLVSRSSFTSITVGPGANVKPKDFDPQIVQTAQPNPLFPPDAQEFTSLDAARPLLPFAPKEPATLPEGFKLAHVWVFPAANPHSNLHAGALIRYSDGMAHFNLYEHLGRPNPDHAHGGHSNDARSERRSVQHWHFPAPDGRVLDVVYIGVLPREQLATVRNSLK